MSEIAKYAVAKVDEKLGLVFGWAITSTEKGEPVFDLQGDHIPDDVMLKAVSDFMEQSRDARDMHTGDTIGTVVHSMPLTAEIAEAFGILTDTTGWMVAMRPSPEVLKQFASGERTGFSIGGQVLESEEPIGGGEE